MRRGLIRALLLAVAVALLVPSAAAAHPLGNFTINHLDVVRVSRDRVDVRYLLDQAEIPTFRERGRSTRAVLAAKRAEVQRGLELRVDGRLVVLRLAPGGRIAFPRGQGGLRTMRVELALSARVNAPRRVELTDRTFAGRVGWRDIVVRPGVGTDVRADVPASEPTRGLRVYPQSLLDSPADRRSASLRVRAGDGTVVAPRPTGSGVVTTRAGEAGAGAGFAGLFDDAAAGDVLLPILLLAAFGWGALHALSPGHGKAMVAAYLVGTRGRAVHAVALGATVTVTHTAGVFALGLVALALSEYILPEDLYPWLNLVAGLLVVAVGAGVLRARLRSSRREHDHDHGHDDHDHGHDHPHDHGHDHPHDHGRHHHHHAQPSGGLSVRGLLALGASAGLIPCPSALVVLLAALSQHEIALGLLLIVSFSLGLAATLTVLGLAIVWASGLAGRLRPRGRLAAVARVLPALSAVVILGVGVALTAQAVPQLI